MSQFVSIARDGAIATVTMDRGDGYNALSRQLILELMDAARSFADDLQTQAVILTGKGGFTAGADLKDPAMDRRKANGLLERRHMTRIGPDLCDAWEKIEQVTICAIEKYCIGGGAALAAACDFRIMGRSAHMRLPEIPLGMNMSWHAVPRLVSLIGPSRTKQFVIFGEKVGAETALAWGLTDEIAADGEALAAAQRWAGKIAKLPPNAVRMSKQSVNAAANALHQATTFMDLDQYALATTSEDYKEAIKAFLEKREPKFTGR
ncbi:MAG TPA: enoyl-CoA hydratase/isomerase family protein [Rhizomicrobium sp.]|jgi:enoyl-CoA hydratase/carnithine racemase|nr:enoyl-CoA hydratase/isomerase family protein [Rhizomicrobium sp.]